MSDELQGTEPTGLEPEAPEAPAAPEAPPAAPPEPETEEVIPLRLRGQEHLVPKRLFDELNEHLGGDAYTTKMRLQRMWDADQVYNETRQRQQEWEQKEAAYNARMQALESERQARLQGHAAPQQPTEEDPMALLRAIREEVASTKQAWQEEREAMKAALEEQYMTDQAAQAHHAYEQLVEQIKSDKRKLPVIPEEALVEEAINSGLAANKRLPWNEVLQRSYRNLAWEFLPQAVEKSTLEKLRDPRATVTVPGGRSAPPPPASPQSDIDKVPFREFIKNLPEGRF